MEEPRVVEKILHSTSQLVDRMKQTSRPIHLIVAIWDPSLTKQELNITIMKIWNIMPGIAGIQPERLERMSILL
jgi:hypothetical protein